MDSKQFDELIARLAEGPSRRDALKGVLGGALASIGLGAALDDDELDAEAKKGKGKGKGKGRGKGKGKKRGGGKAKGKDDDVDEEGNKKRRRRRRRKRKKKKKCKLGPGETRCSKKVCTDLQTDPDNCGSCGLACLTDETCVAGVCTPAT